MADPKSVTPEELKQIQDIQLQYTVLTRRFGELHFQERLLDAEKKDVEAQMDALEQTRVNVMANLQNKYGAGSIDINTGLLTPASATETVAAAVTQ